MIENMDMERFADLLRKLIEKYADKIDWDSLPDPPKPPADEVDGFSLEKVCLFLYANIKSSIIYI